MGYTGPILVPYWSILLHTGPILVYSGPYWSILVTYWSILFHTGLYWTHTRLYWSILSCTGVYWTHTRLYCSILVYTGPILAYTGLYWVVLGHTGPILVYTGPYWPILVPYWSILVYTGLYWGIPDPYWSILVHTGPILVHTGPILVGPPAGSAKPARPSNQRPLLGSRRDAIGRRPSGRGLAGVGVAGRRPAVGGVRGSPAPSGTGPAPRLGLSRRSRDRGGLYPAHCGGGGAVCRHFRSRREGEGRGLRGWGRFSLVGGQMGGA